MSFKTSKKQQTPAHTPCRMIRGHTRQVEGVVHLPDGRCIITCSVDSSLRLWDLESGAQIGEDWRDENRAGVWSVALSPNGKTVASGSDDGKVMLWNIKTKKVIAKWTGHADLVCTLCWSADSKRVASGSWDGTARVWNVKSGKPKSTKIATCGRDENAAKIWDAKTSKLLATLKHDIIVLSLAWTSDGKKFISATYGPIRIFDTATWQQIAILDGHTWVNAIFLSRNDRLLVSVSTDKTARLWNLDTNLPVCPLLQHEDEVKCAAFSADGQVLITGDEDKNVYRWDIHAMLKEAGLEDLLLPIPNVPCRKSLIDVRQLCHTLTPSFANPRALFRRFSSLFRCAQSNTDGVTELQQLPRQSVFSCGSSIVERPAVLDTKPLGVAKQLKREHLHTRPDGISTTTPGATPAESQFLQLLAHLMLSPCPSSTSDANTAATTRPIARPSPAPGIISACRCLDIRDTSCSCC